MLDIPEVEAKYGKYANNTEFSGEKFTTGWTLPLDFHLTCEQFEHAIDKKYFTRAMFEDRKGTKYSLWKGMHKGMFALESEFKNAAFTMVFAGGKCVEWDDDCGVSKIQYEPVDNGMIHLTGNVYVHPDAAQKRLLEQFQHSTVTISMSGAEVAAKVKDKQQDMFGKEAAKDGEPNGKGKNGEGDDFEQKAKAQVDAFKRGRPVGGLPDTH